MSAKCVLSHPVHPLSHAIFAKAALEGVQFLAPPQAFHELQERHAGVISAVPQALIQLTGNEGGTEDLGGEFIVHFDDR